MKKYLFIILFAGCFAAFGEDNNAANLSKNFNLSESFLNGYGSGTGTYIAKAELYKDELVITGDIQGRLKLPPEISEKLNMNDEITLTYVWVRSYSVFKNKKNSFELHYMPESKKEGTSFFHPDKSSLLMESPDLKKLWQFAGMDFIEHMRSVLDFHLYSNLAKEDPELKELIKNYIDDSFRWEPLKISNSIKI